MDALSFPSTRQVRAVVVDVLPSTGLAYVEDEAGSCWGLTRSVGIEGLQRGERVLLTVTDHGRFSIATGWNPVGHGACASPC